MTASITINYQGVDTVLSVPCENHPASIVVDGSGPATMIAATPVIESPVVIVGNPTGPMGSIKIEGSAVAPVLIVGRVGDFEPPDLEKMVHPLFPITRRAFEVGAFGISKVSVYSGFIGGILLFERTIEYDGDQVSVVQTDDMLNNTRLIKTMLYSGDDLICVRRELTP